LAQIVQLRESLITTKGAEIKQDNFNKITGAKLPNALQ
jgi:hypothetical protein